MRKTNTHLTDPMRLVWISLGSAMLLMGIPIAVSIANAPAKAAASASAAASAASVAATEVPHTANPYPSQAAQTVAPAQTTRAAQPTQAAGGHGVTLYFTADAGASVSVTYVCGPWRQMSCNAASGASVSVTGVASGSVGMQCRITVDGQVVVRNHGTGSLACSTVVP